MTSFLAILGFIALAVGGGFLTLVFLQVFVPLIVRALGEDKFAAREGFEPCSTVLFSGIAGGVLYSLVSQKWGAIPALLLFPVLSLLSVGYFVTWLRLAASGQGKKEFEIREGKIVRLRDAQILAPSYVLQETDFRQTDAFHSYSFYHLVLCDESGPLARNGYLQKEPKQLALREILESGGDVSCRAVDLIFVRRSSDTLWWQVRLEQEDATLLCGPLELLPEASRLWWRRWLRPQFPEDGFDEIPAAELEEHFTALKNAYPAILPASARPSVEPEELEAKMAALDRKEDWNQLVELSKEYRRVRENVWIRIEMLLRRNEAPIQLMTQQRFEAEVKKVAPNGATLMYGSVGGHENALIVEIKAR